MIRRRFLIVAVQLLSIVAATRLAPRAALAASPPTNVEQYMLEVVNRGRLNPDGEVWRLRNQTWGDTGSPQAPDLNEGIAAASALGHESRQPLALNDMLIQAARDYSNTLLANNAFQHTYGGTDPGSRMSAAGYSFSGNWGWGENLSLTYASFPLTMDASMANSQYQGLFIDGNVAGRGHRENLMSDSMKEVGIGMAATSSASYTPPGGSGNWYAVITTQDFAYSGGSFSGKPFLTGVVYSDTSVNNFYDPGEGLGGGTVSATLTSGGSATTTTTWSSGGYSLPLSPGTYNVTFSSSGLSGPITYSNVVVGTSNVKLDASSDLGVWNLDGSGTWSTPGNWSGVEPSGSGKSAYFGGKITSARTISISAADTVGTIAFNSSASYSITGTSTLTLALSGDRARVFDYAGSHSIGTPINLASGVDVTVLAASDSLTLAGAISTPSGQSLVKLGKGTLSLAGSNTFNGLTVADGTLSVSSGSALGSSGGTLGFASDNTAILATAAVTIANAILVASGSGGTRTLGATITSGTATFGGGITLNHDVLLTSSSGGFVRFSGSLTGSGSLTKVGAGKLVLSGSNDFSGGTTVSAGVLIVANVNALRSGTSLTVGNSAPFASDIVPAPAPTIAATAVPEPSSLPLLAVAVTLAAWRLGIFNIRRARDGAP
jgi:autotransporter-associated beta strand protein